LDQYADTVTPFQAFPERYQLHSAAGIRLSTAMEWPGLCIVKHRTSAASECGALELWSFVRRLDRVMKNENGMFGLVVGCIVALVAFAFIFSGGSFGGKTVIDGDQDLPPVETTNN
jgi:hypothetical protein